MLRISAGIYLLTPVTGFGIFMFKGLNYETKDSVFG